MTKTKVLFRDLFSKGVKELHIKWEAGGDDGSICDIDCVPESKAVAEEFAAGLRQIGWEVYETQFGGATAGDFHVDGSVTIKLKSDGSYDTKAINNYEEDGEYDEETDTYGESMNEERLRAKNFDLLEDVDVNSQW